MAAPQQPVRRAGLGLRSRVVAWLRVLLPLAALALLATLFMWQSRPDIESAIPWVEGDADTLSGPPRITAPEWAGLTEDGAEVVLSATSATQPGSAGAAARAVRLDWQGRGGTRAEATAPAATMEGDQILLQGGVWLRLSTGWELDADEVRASRSLGEVIASGAVAITGPFATLTADRARLHQTPAEGDAPPGEVLDFTGHVRLRYQP